MRKFWHTDQLTSTIVFTLVAGLMIFGNASRADAPVFSSLIGITPEGQTCLMGGAMRGVIAEPDVLVDLMKHKQPHTLYRLAEQRGEVWSVGPPDQADMGGDCENSYLQDLTLSNDQLGLLQVALSGKPEEVAKRLPTTLERLGLDNPKAREIMTSHLKKAGLDNPKLRIRQVVSADLNGDGKTELLINALNTARGDIKAGEYSVVLLVRKTENGQKIIPVYEEIMLKDSSEPSIMVEQTIVSIVDIDGDGQSEVILFGAFAYGEGWQALRIKENDITQVLYCGCG